MGRTDRTGKRLETPLKTQETQKKHTIYSLHPLTMRARAIEIEQLNQIVDNRTIHSLGLRLPRYGVLTMPSKHAAVSAPFVSPPSSIVPEPPPITTSFQSNFQPASTRIVPMQRTVSRLTRAPAWTSAPSILTRGSQNVRPKLAQQQIALAPLPPTRTIASLAQHSDARIRSNDPDAVAVVVGGSRGIGQGLLKGLVARGWKGHLVGTSRNPDDWEAGEGLEGRVVKVGLDVCDEESVERAAGKVRSVGGGRLDLVVVTAGVLHEEGKMPETALRRVDGEFLRRNLEVNLMGPVLVAKHLTPMMVTAKKEGRVPSIFAALSARVGSISDNRLGGWLSYRASKAGQNQAMRTISIEVGRRGIICLSLHPGTVKTGLSQPFWPGVRKDKLFEVDFAAGKLLDVMESVGIEQNGAFLDYGGNGIEY